MSLTGKCILFNKTIKGPPGAHPGRRQKVDKNKYLKIRIDFIEAETGKIRFTDFGEYRQKDYTQKNIEEYLQARQKVAEHNYQTPIKITHRIIG